MTQAIPTKEPTEIFSGDTVAWRREDLTADYPATSWALKYYFRGPCQATVTATADGANFAITVTAATTAAWNEGIYWWAAQVSKGSEAYTVTTGQLYVKKNFAAADVDFDGRSHVKKTLDNLEATIERLSAEDLTQYSIAQRQAVRHRLLELGQMRDSYAAQYAAEIAKAKSDQGLSPGRKILARF